VLSSPLQGDEKTEVKKHSAMKKGIKKFSIEKEGESNLVEVKESLRTTAAGSPLRSCLKRS
jgi:hypothetical protein